MQNEWRFEARLLDSDLSDAHRFELQGLREVFGRSMGLAPPDLPEAPAFANSTRAVMRRHSALVLEQLKDVDGLREAEQLLKVASLLARRLQLLIENAPRACFFPKERPEVSVTLLLNFYIAQLEHNGRSVGRDLVREMYGDASSLRVASRLRVDLKRLGNAHVSWLFVAFLRSFTRFRASVGTR